MMEGRLVMPTAWSTEEEYLQNLEKNLALVYGCKREYDGGKIFWTLQLHAMQVGQEGKVGADTLHLPYIFETEAEAKTAAHSLSFLFHTWGRAWAKRNGIGEKET